MNPEIAVLIAIAGVVLSLVTFVAGRQGASKYDGQQTGAMIAKLDSCKEGIERLNIKQDMSEKNYAEIIHRLTIVEESSKSAHKRIDGFNIVPSAK